MVSFVMRMRFNVIEPCQVSGLVVFLIFGAHGYVISRSDASQNTWKTFEYPKVIACDEQRDDR